MEHNILKEVQHKDADEPVADPEPEQGPNPENKEDHKEEHKNVDIDGNESDDSINSWDDPDPLFQEIYKMVSKPSKLMRKATLTHDKFRCTIYCICSLYPSSIPTGSI